MVIKGTYHCQTTHHPNTLNSWDIRSVSVDLPEVQDKPYWHKIRSSCDRVRAGGDRMVVGVWVLKMSTYKKAGEP